MGCLRALPGRHGDAHRQAHPDQSEQGVDLDRFEWKFRVEASNDRGSGGQRVGLSEHGVRTCDREIGDHPRVDEVTEVDDTDHATIESRPGPDDHVCSRSSRRG